MAITYREAAKTIRKEVDNRGQYSHNIISLILRQVSEELGIDKANKLVKDYNLFIIFGIRQELE